MKLGRVDHITLNVTDIKAATKFYENLGMTVEGTLDDGNIVFLTNGDPERPLQIQLDGILPDSTGLYAKPGLNHIAFLVDDVDGATEELKEKGIEGRHEPFYQSRSGRKILTFMGPDDVGLQLAKREGRGEYEDFK